MMWMKQNWKVAAFVSLALIGRANAAEEKSGAVTVNPNQVVVQVYGIV